MCNRAIGRPAGPPSTWTTARAFPSEWALSIASGTGKQHMVPSFGHDPAGMVLAQCHDGVIHHGLTANLVHSFYTGRTIHPAHEVGHDLLGRLPTHVILDQLDRRGPEPSFECCLSENRCVLDRRTRGRLVDRLRRGRQPSLDHGVELGPDCFAAAVKRHAGRETALWPQNTPGFTQGLREIRCVLKPMTAND